MPQRVVVIWSDNVVGHDWTILVPFPLHHAFRIRRAECIGIQHQQRVVPPVPCEPNTTPDCWIVFNGVRCRWIQTDKRAYTFAIAPCATQ